MFSLKQKENQSGKLIQILKIIDSEGHSLQIHLLDAVSDMMQGRDVQEPLTKMFNLIMEHEGKNFILDKLDTRMKGLDDKLNRAENEDERSPLLLEKSMLKAMHAITSGENAQPILSGLLSEITSTYGRKWVNEGIRQLEDKLDIPPYRLNLTELNGFIERNTNKIYDQILPRFNEVKEELTVAEGAILTEEQWKNRRNQTLKLLNAIKDDCLLLDISEDEKTDQIALLNKMSAIVERDARGISAHMIDMMKIVFNTESGHLGNKLKELFTLVAKSEGRTVILSEINDLKKQATQDNKVTRIDFLLMKSENDLEAYKEDIKALKEFLKDPTKSREAINKMKELLENAKDNENAIKALNRIKVIVDDADPGLQTHMLDIFSAVLEGGDVGTHMLNAYKCIRDESDRIYFQELHDILTKPKDQGGGVEALISHITQRMTKQGNDSKSIPHYLKGMIKYILGVKGRTEILELGKSKGGQLLYEWALGKNYDHANPPPDETFVDTFEKKVDKWVKKYMNIMQEEEEEEEGYSSLANFGRQLFTWFNGPGKERLTAIIGSPLLNLLEKYGALDNPKNLQDFVTDLLKFDPETFKNIKFAANRTPDDVKKCWTTLETTLSLKNREALHLAVINALVNATGINKGVNPAERNELVSKNKRLDENIKALGEGVKDASEKILEIIKSEMKKEEIGKVGISSDKKRLNLNDFVVARHDDSLSFDRFITFTTIGDLHLGMNVDDFDLLLQIVIKTAILEGRKLIGKVKDDDGNIIKSGSDLVCQLGADAAKAMSLYFEGGRKKTEFDHQEATKGIIDKLLGVNFSKLQLTPIAQMVVGAVLAPKKGSIENIFAGVTRTKPVGEKVFEELLNPDNLTNLFDDVLANQMEEKLVELEKKGNIYDQIFDFYKEYRSQKELKLTQCEKKFQEAIGKLAFTLVKKYFDPKWAKQLDKYQGPFKTQELFEKGVGAFMLPLIKDFLREELGLEENSEITIDQVYDYCLKKSADSLDQVIKEERSIFEKLGDDTERTIKAQKNLARLARYAEPVLKHHSFAGVIFGGIAHFLAKITIVPLMKLLSMLAKAICRRTGKKYEESLWYALTEKPKQQKHLERAGKLYDQTTAIINSEGLINRIYERMIRGRVFRDKGFQIPKPIPN